MQKHNLEEMTKGWFIGNFEPSVYKTNDFEVAVKKYKKGDKEAAHHHKIATEITVIVSGIVRMNGKQYTDGEIVVIFPNETTDFEALTNVVTTVVKHPCVNNDKYIGASF
jgi:mannose-6-phosphate isomerase-like protein (cupin superfamily)